MRRNTPTLATASKPSSEKHRENYPPPVIVDFNKISPEDRTSVLCHMVCDQTLPILIRMTKSYAPIKGAPPVLKKGELLLLCFVVEIPVVHATLGKNTDYRLPVHATQLYQKLPRDPALDYKEYKGTKSLIESKPLPDAVRVVDAICSADTMANQDPGDVIMVKGVEVDDHPERGRERVLVGLDSLGKEVRYSESMDLSAYSTMICEDLLPMSELVKFDMPQRACLRDAEEKKKDSKRVKTPLDKLLKLHRYEKEWNVIAARAREPVLLSIPLSSALEFEVETGTLQEISPILPAIFNRTNATWCVTDVTQCRLPEGFRSIPQPQPEVLKAWAKSYEGKKMIEKVHEKHLNELRQIIAERQTEITRLRRNLNIPRHSLPGKTTDIHRRRTFAPGKAPPVPAKVPNMTMTLNRRHSALPLASSTLDSRYETVDFIANAEKEKQPAEILKELQADLHAKEEAIFDLQMQTRKEKETYEVLKKERDDMKSSCEADQHEIIRLQTMIDQLKGGNIYEDIDEFKETHYSTPFSGKRVSKKMDISEVLAFLKETNLTQYCEVFEQEKIDGAMLFELDEEIMKTDLKMRKLDARKLSTRMSELK